MGVVMAEEFSSANKTISNNTYIKNKEYGYPHAAGSIDDLYYHNDLPVATEAITYNSAPISTKAGAYIKYRFKAVSGFSYTMDVTGGIGSASILSGPSFPLVGDDNYYEFIVQVNAVGIGNQFSLKMICDPPIPTYRTMNTSATYVHSVYAHKMAYSSISTSENIYDKTYIDVFDPTTNTISNEQIIQSPEPSIDFGRDNLLYDSFLLSSAPLSNTTSGNASGAVFVHKFDGTSWNLHQKIVPSGITDNSHFANDGWDAIGQNIAVFWHSGYAYVFEYDPANDLWGETAKISSSGTIRSVTVNEEGTFIGINHDDGCHVFAKVSGTWTEIALLQSHGYLATEYASRTQIVGNYAFHGTWYSNDSRGYVDFFEYTNGTWEWRQTLSYGTTPNNQFGRWLQFSSNTLVVGIPGDDNPAYNAGGLVFFRRDNTGMFSFVKLEKIRLSYHRGLGTKFKMHNTLIAAYAEYAFYIYY